MHLASISPTSVIPTMTTWYSALLLVVRNSNFKDTSTTNSELFSRIIPTLLPMLLDERYVNTTHMWSYFGEKVSSRPGSLWTTGFSKHSLPRRILRIQTIRCPTSYDAQPGIVGIAPALEVYSSELPLDVRDVQPSLVTIIVAYMMLLLTPRLPFRSTSSIFFPR